MLPIKALKSLPFSLCRGLAHVGMIKAMVDAGIPIDMVAGTSMGSFIGALWSEELNITRFMQRSREWSFVSITV